MSFEEDLRKNVLDLQRIRSQQRAHFADCQHAAVLSGQEKTPDAPHPDEKWRLRSRKVFLDAKKFLFVEHMPWHHQEIWLWAASTGAGQDWIEESIAFWEKEVARQRRAGERLLERLRVKQGFAETDYVYEDGDELAGL